MIKITSERDNGGFVSTPMVKEDPAAKALAYMVEFELAYGGSIVEISETLVKIRTCILGCIDHTTFEGTKAEMELIYKVAGFSAILNADHHDQIVDASMKNLMAMTGGNPRLLDMAGAMVIGAKASKFAVLCALDNLCALGAETLPFLIKVSLKDLVTVLSMVFAKEATFDEALSLV